jgi:tetratricopeptide (TPR) repeat protein
MLNVNHVMSSLWATLLLSSAVIAQSDQADRYFEVGLDYSDNGQHEEAIRYFTRAIEADPSFGNAWGNRGLSYLRLEQYDKAIADCTIAISKHSRRRTGDEVSPEIDYDNRAEAYCGIGEYRKAIADYETSLRLKPNATYALNAFAWLLATCPEDEIRDGQRAFKYAEKATGLTRDKDGGYLDTLAAAYAECGDFESAVKYQAKAIQISDPDPEMDARLELYRKNKSFRTERVKK